MSTDAELLRRYADERSETAFAELVQRHLNLVYFAALRQVGGDAHGAKDVAQSVFTDLARKARSLTDRATLTGWLHTSTRFAAAKVRRADFSRQQHEHEAATMNAFLPNPDPNSTAEWERLRPMIDDVIHELDDRDREAVLLRFFENRPFAEIGATLHLSEDAARMRVDRALDKLRAALARRGVKSTSAALATVFANQVAASAPAGLASAITDTALTSVVASGGLAAAGVGIFMSIKTTAILSAVALAAMAATFSQWNRAFRAESELTALTVDRDGLRAQLRAEQQSAGRAAEATAALRSELDALKAKPATVQSALRATPPVTTAQTTAELIPGSKELMRSAMNRAIMGNLQVIAAARVRFQQANGRLPASINELGDEEKFIKALVPINGEDYLSLSLAAGSTLTVTDSEGVSVSYDPSAPAAPRPVASAAERRARVLLSELQPAITKAVAAFNAAHPGVKPHSPEELLPYFSTPQEGANYAEAVAAMAAARGK